MKNIILFLFVVGPFMDAYANSEVDSFRRMDVSQTLNSLVLPVSQNSFYIKGRIENKIKGKAFLQIHNALMDSLLIHIYSGSNLVGTYEMGDKYKYSQRLIDYRYFLIPIPEGEDSLHYKMKLNRSAHPMYIPLNIISEADIIKKKNKYRLFIGVILGIYIMYLFLLLVAYLSFKFSFLLIYCGYVFSGLLLFTQRLGIGYSDFWGNNIYIQNALDAVEGLALIFIFWFFLNVLNFRNHNGILKRWVQVSIGFNGLIVLFEFAFPFLNPDFISIFEILAQGVPIINFFSIVIVLYISIRSSTGSLFNFYNWYIIAVISFSSIFLLIASYYWGLYPHNELIFEYGIPIVFLIEILFMIITLFNHYSKSLRDEIELKLALTESNLESSQNLQKGIERERERIRRDLHDGLGADLSGVRYFLDAAQHSQEKKQSLLQEGISKLDLSILELRNIINNISPASLSLEEWKLAIAKLISQSEKISSFKVTSLIQIDTLSKEQKEHVLKIYQELLQNAVKHSQANSINLSLKKVDNMITFSYRDDGIGFHNTYQNKDGHYGMENIKSRIQIMGGTLKLNPTEKGVDISFVIAN